jgi:hypothetical protein
MTTASDLWGQDSPRNADLRRLMLMCKTGGQFIYLVCVGAGDAFINRYFPTLRMYVNQNKLRLLVADEKPLERIIQERVGQALRSDKKAADNLKEKYEEFASYVKGDKPVLFVNTLDDHDKIWYDHIRADIVLVLVPDDVHIRVAKRWLNRSTLILVEKPYNRDLEEVKQFEDDLKRITNEPGGPHPITWVCPFDHYLAKIADYAVNKESSFVPFNRERLIERIGGLKSVEFGLLEAGPVESWRLKSLEAGMIYDLFSHVLAMLDLEVRVETFSHERVNRIAVARHSIQPIRGKARTNKDTFIAETFAYFDFKLFDRNGNRIPITGSVGKGVGDRDDKFLTFTGETGWLKCDLNPHGSKEILIKESRDDAGSIATIKGGHAEFIATLLDGKYIEEPIGRLAGDTAVQILHILNSIRGRIPKTMYEYEIGTDKATIENNATLLRFRS